MSRPSPFILAIIALLALACVSCVGVSADVEIGADGSGTLRLEYRVARMVDAMGKVGGEDRYLPLPITRADFERVVQSNPGLTLETFRMEQDEVDSRVSASLRFADPAALAAFLKASGRTVNFSRENGANALSVRISEGGGPLDADLRQLVQNVFRGYRLELSVTTPTVPTCTPPGQVIAEKRAARLAVSIESLLSSKEIVTWTVSWKDRP